MVCIYCSAPTQVTNSRHQKRANNVWRRRRCTQCGAIYSTIEAADYEKSWVVRSLDGALTPFLRDKLLVSIYKSSQHRPEALQDARALTHTVLSNLHPLVEDGAISAHTIAREVLAVLNRFDSPAATHYQAFHAASLKG